MTTLTESPIIVTHGNLYRDDTTTGHLVPVTIDPTGLPPTVAPFTYADIAAAADRAVDRLAAVAADCGVTDRRAALGIARDTVIMWLRDDRTDDAVASTAARSRLWTALARYGDVVPSAR